MEKRKLLLVSISAGIFLVIAIGAAIVFTPQDPVVAPTTVALYPAPGGTAIPAAPVEPQVVQTLPVPVSPMVDPVELVRVPVDNLGLLPAPEGIRTQDEPRVITVSPPSAVAVPGTPPPARPIAPTPAPAKPAPASKPVPAPAAPKPAAPVAATPRVTTPSTAEPASINAAPASARRSVTPPPRPGSVQNDFWVQAGSFTTMANAEKAQDALAGRGITSIIENRATGNDNWFRVRVGPYPSKDEANHWRHLIAEIGGFEQSLVWQTIRN
ncbi:MAG: SPOR domain-containing protein [Treponema sp.]|nr:SPOR domain-containing protein [Treponema sp.]